LGIFDNNLISNNQVYFRYGSLLYNNFINLANNKQFHPTCKIIRVTSLSLFAKFLYCICYWLDYFTDCGHIKDVIDKTDSDDEAGLTKK
jgi:hypothetical protein